MATSPKIEIAKDFILCSDDELTASLAFVKRSFSRATVKFIETE